VLASVLGHVLSPPRPIDLTDDLLADCGQLSLQQMMNDTLGIRLNIENRYRFNGSVIGKLTT